VARSIPRTHGERSPPVTSGIFGIPGNPYRPGGVARAMLSEPARTGVSPPPADLDAAIEWLAGVSDRLVLLEEVSPGELMVALGRSDDLLRVHLETADRAWTGAPRVEPSQERLAATLRSDHLRCLVSLDQLGWFLEIVVGENHGGHR
jgi:hypothetical protein